MSFGSGQARRAGAARQAALERARLRAQVEAARRQVAAGKGPRADSGDVARGSKPSLKASLESVAGTARSARLTPVAKKRGLVESVVHDVGDALPAAARFVANHAVLSGGAAGFGSGALQNKITGSKGGSGIAAALAPRPTNVRDSKVGVNILKDAGNFPKDAVIAGVEIGHAALDAAHGDTKRAKRLIGGLDDGALGRLVLHADPKGAAKAFEAHPLYSGLEVTGTGQVVGRGAGAVARSGVLGRAAKRAGATKRAPLVVVEGTGQKVERSYSKNLGVKAGQVASDRAKASLGLDPNVARGGRRSHLLNQGVDEFAAQAEGLRRRGREEAARGAATLAPVRRGVGATGLPGRAAAALDRGQARAAEGARVPGVRARPERDVVLAAVEGRLHGPKTFKADLTRERDRLQSVYVAERQGMSAGARSANRAQVKALDRVISDPKALANAPEVFRAADEYNTHAHKLEQDLIGQGVLKRGQADAARVRSYGVAVMGLKPSLKGEGLVGPDGKVVSTAAIRMHIRANGHREPGFVGHRRDERGAASYFVNWFGGRKTVDSKTRTGEAARTGGYDASFNALEQHLVRGRGVTDAVKTFDDFVGRFGTKRMDGAPFTWDEAQRSAGELGEATGTQWVPVRAVPARYDEATREGILEHQGTSSVPGNLDSLTVGRIDDSLKDPPPAERGARNVVLVPADQVARFRQHQTSGTSTAGKVGQMATRAFRGTVLPFSTKWLAGNVTEAYAVRLPAAGVTPADVLYYGPKVMRNLKVLDEEAWKAADTRIRGGLMYGSGDRLNVRRSSEDFRGRLRTTVEAGEMVMRLPVMRQISGGLKAYQRGVFALNRGLERAAQTGVIGKQARLDAQELTGSWGKALAMQQQVAEEVARGLLGTPKQEQFARMADEVLGKYNRFSPSTRRIIQTVAPFLPWFLNAARFVGHTLPVHHPAKTALLTNVETTLHDENQANRKKVPPGDLESAIRMKDGGLLNLARYTPFGAFTSGTEGIVAPLLPQLDSVVKVLEGKSFTGNDLRLQSGDPPTEGKKAWLALYTLLEGSVPGVQIARRFREGGSTPFDDSTVVSPKTKPGTKHGGAANRILNPLRPTYLSGGSGGGSAPANPAQEREARAILREQQSASAQKQQAALEREARAILAEQRALRP